MNERMVELQHKVDELLEVLERDTEHIRRSLSRLNELRSFVIKRDEQALGRLLEDIRIEAEQYAANDRRRGSVREELAKLLGYKTEQLTLSVLKTLVSEQAKPAIAERQQQLRTLVKQLQREYVSTVALVSDCARINSLLLKNIFERGGAGLVCYDSTGLASRDRDTAFVSVRM